MIILKIYKKKLQNILKTIFKGRMELPMTVFL